MSATFVRCMTTSPCSEEVLSLKLKSWYCSHGHWYCLKGDDLYTKLEITIIISVWTVLLFQLKIVIAYHHIQGLALLYFIFRFRMIHYVMDQPLTSKCSHDNILICLTQSSFKFFHSSV